MNYLIALAVASRVLRTSLCVALLLLLPACASKPQVVEKVEPVEVFVPSYKPLDPRLTQADAEPKAPPAKCRDADGQLTACNSDVSDYIDDLRKWGRGMKKQLTEILGLQPKPTP